MSTGCWGHKLMQMSREPPGQPSITSEVVVGAGRSVVVVGELTGVRSKVSFVIKSILNIQCFVEASNSGLEPSIVISGNLV